MVAWQTAVLGHLEHSTHRTPSLENWLIGTKIAQIPFPARPWPTAWRILRWVFQKKRALYQALKEIDLGEIYFKSSPLPSMNYEEYIMVSTSGKHLLYSPLSLSLSYLILRMWNKIQVSIQEASLQRTKTKGWSSQGNTSVPISGGTQKKHVTTPVEKKQNSFQPQWKPILR